MNDLIKPNDLTNLPTLKEKVERQKEMGNAFNSFTYEETPEEFIYQREGADGKIMDYIKQFYVIRVLNSRFFPWEVKNKKFWYQPEVRTWVFTADLCVTYPDLITGELRKRCVPGIGAAYVHSRKDDPTIPVQPDDMAKAARTEFIKNAAYWLGIGFDIYSQEIPMSLRDEFEDRIREWRIKEPILKYASKLQTKKGFARFIKGLPTKEQTKRFITILNNIPKEKHNALWEIYIGKTSMNANIFLDELETKLKGGNNG